MPAARSTVIEQSAYKTARLWLTKKDRWLAKVINIVGPCTIQPEPLQSPFEALGRAIVYQQLSGKAAATIFARVKALHGDKLALEPEDILLSGEDRLRSAGCSRAKAMALTDLAIKTKSGIVPTMEQMEAMSDAELIDLLSSVRGVGRWTVEMLLMFRLGRMDVMPSTDLGIRKGFAVTYKLVELPSPKEVFDYAQRWQPYRTVGSWYLWRANEI